MATNATLQRVYFNPNGFMRDITYQVDDTLYVGKDRIHHYTIDHVLRYNPHIGDAVFIVSDDEGHETTMKVSACHVDTRTRHTYIYSADLHRVFKFDAEETMFLFEDFVFHGEVPNRMTYLDADISSYYQNLKLW